MQDQNCTKRGGRQWVTDTSFPSAQAVTHDTRAPTKKSRVSRLLGAGSSRVVCVELAEGERPRRCLEGKVRRRVRRALSHEHWKGGRKLSSSSPKGVNGESS